MRRLFYAVGIAAVIAATGTLMPSRADAMTPGTPAGIGTAVDHLSIVDPVAFIYRGARHCFYHTGWHGAGWYRCGYRWRRGLGWGGPAGFRGWVVPPAVIVRPVRPRHRRPAIIIRP